MLPREVTTVSVDFSALEDAYRSGLRESKPKPAGHFTLDDLAASKGLSRWQAGAWIRAGLDSGLLESGGLWGKGNARLYRYAQSHA